MTDKMGGQAFPRAGFTGKNGFGRPTNGMTLWDYYAAAALTGMVATTNTSDWTSLAKLSADQADAMLKERAKRMEQGDE